ncbi:LysR family transcriptional regulator [Amorphus coralli]|uniref:LysR family transcriptional regulator n=1 Tax=Amorphus coralli TaxID=340680 RepID=UPI00037499DD|nr:LysR family transcriptional regulator [Amorphus coralli]
MDRAAESLSDLYRFMEIADQGSLTSAAERLGISQSALTRSVQSLEHAYGSRLLDRGKRGARLTDSGKLFLQRAREMVELHEATVREISAFDADPGGRVRIGLPISTSRVFATPLVARLAERHPRIRLAITEDISENMEIGLSRGHLDLAVLVSPKTRRGRLHTAPMASEQLLAVMPPGHPLADRARLGWRDLAGQTMVAHPDGNFMRHWLTRMNARYGLGVRLATEVNSRTLMVELVRAGIGVALMPGSAVTEEIASGTVVGRPLGSMRLVWSVAYDAQRAPAGITGRVEETMRELARDLAKGGIWTAISGAG